MPLQDAVKFIKEASRNRELRSSLYTVNQTQILPELKKQGYSFSLDEFEESFNALHVQCQTEEQAYHLFEIVNWFRMLIYNY